MFVPNNPLYLKRPPSPTSPTHPKSQKKTPRRPPGGEGWVGGGVGEEGKVNKNNLQQCIITKNSTRMDDETTNPCSGEKMTV